MSAYVQVRGKGFIKKLLDEALTYLMSKDRNADLGTNASVLKVLAVVSVLLPAFKPLQKIIPE